MLGSARANLGRVLVLALVAAGLALVQPLAPLDRGLQRSLLEAGAPAEPLRTVFLITVNEGQLSDEGCTTALSGVVGTAPRLVVLTPPVATLCPTDGPAEVLDRSFVAEEDGHVRGVAVDAWPSELGSEGPAAGHAGPLLAPGSARRVPGARLTDFLSGALSNDLLRGRIVVVGADDPSWSATHWLGSEPVPLAAAVASIVGATLESGQRDRWSPAGAAIVCVAFAAAMALWGLRQRLRTIALATLVALLALHGFDRLMAGRPGGTLAPFASIALSFVSSAIAAATVAQAQKGRARDRTADLVRRGALFRPIGTDEGRDPNFWSRLAAWAAQVFPTTSVAVFELAPAATSAQVRAAHGPTAETLRGLSLPRSGPAFEGAAGLPGARFIELPGAPDLVAVPFGHGHELTGCLVFDGPTAREAAASPARVAALVREVGALVERRRAANGASGGAGRFLSPREGELLAVAKLGAEDRRALAQMMNRATVGLLFADALGDVRLLGGLFRDVLALRGVQLELDEGAALQPGVLALEGVVTPLTGLTPREVADRLSALLDEASVVRFEVRVGEREHRSFTLEASAVRDRERDDAAAGYFAVLVETTQPFARIEAGAEAMALFRARAADICMAIQGLALLEDVDGLRDSLPRIVARSEELMDTLTTFGPSVESNPENAVGPYSLLNVVRSAIALVGTQPRAITLDAPASVQAVLGRRSEILHGLRAVLEQLVSGSSETSLLLTVREWRAQVELTIVDSTFGAPASLLARVDEYPDLASEDSQAVGALLSMVRRSQGVAHVRGDAGSGMTLTLRLPKNVLPQENIVDEGTSSL